MKKNTSYSIKSIFGIEPIRGCVYIVRKNKEVVYIGLAEKQSVQSRLCKHLESFFSSNKASKFSTLLQKNNPKNFLWRVDILTIEQAGEITRTAYDCLKCAEQGVYDFFIRKQLVIAGNKTRPQSCNKKYMVKGCWSIMKGGVEVVFLENFVYQKKLIQSMALILKDMIAQKPHNINVIYAQNK